MLEAMVFLPLLETSTYDIVVLNLKTGHGVVMTKGHAVGGDVDDSEGPVFGVWVVNGKTDHIAVAKLRGAVRGILAVELEPEGIDEVYFAALDERMGSNENLGEDFQGVAGKTRILGQLLQECGCFGVRLIFPALSLGELWTLRRRGIDACFVVALALGGEEARMNLLGQMS